jgi:hypothetical protein
MFLKKKKRLLKHRSGKSFAGMCGKESHLFAAINEEAKSYLVQSVLTMIRIDAHAAVGVDAVKLTRFYLHVLHRDHYKSAYSVKQSQRHR